MKAIFQGEFHVSKSDKSSLLSQFDEDVDALFIEQREDRFSPDGWTFGYMTFLASTIVYFWFQAFLDRGEGIEHQVDVPIHDEIDLALPDLFQIFPTPWVLFAQLISVGIFIYGVFMPLAGVPILQLPHLIELSYAVLAKLILVLGASVSLSAILIHMEEYSLGARDAEMAKNIVEISEENEYQTVVVSCGNMHLDRLPELLEDDGWEVEVHGTNHSLASKLWSN